MNLSVQSERYSKVAERELQSRSPRQPQWIQAVAQTDGDLETATGHYVSTRVTEISDQEREHKAAEKRLLKLRQFNDGLAPRGGFLIALFVAPIIFMAGWWVYQFYSK